MIPCNHTYELNKYLDQEAEDQRIQEEREAMIEANAKELMLEGGSCYPWSMSNIFEALSNLDFSAQLMITTYITTSKDLPNNIIAQELCAKAIRDEITNYWLKVAKHLAEKEL